MSLKEEVELFTKLSGKDGQHTPVGIIGAYLAGYEKGKCSKTDWILCEERLPENDKSYLVLHECDGHYWNQVVDYNDGWNCTKDSKEYEMDDIIAWMPLPAPPTISKKEQVERREQ